MAERVPVGFTFAGVPAGIKKTGAADLALIVSDRPCAAAAVFTQNRFPAAPVLYDRRLVAENSAGLRGVVINAGCANACTGDEGLADAAQMAAEAELAAGLPPHTCAVMSTGVIGVRLPLDKIRAGVRLAATQLTASGWETAACAIMTTDTRPKVAFREVDGIRLFGMCKGAGMIHPNMATMLAAIVTDAAIAPAALDKVLRGAVEVSFNSISVDGDTSTNDTVLVLANGAAGAREVQSPEALSAFTAAFTSLCTDLAQQIVRDGEGATKFITIHVTGAASHADARRAAKAIANSPLVKTAFYGGDANWGRILCAVGYSGAAVEPDRADLWIAARHGGHGSHGVAGYDAGGEEAARHGGHGGPLLQLVAGGRPLAYSEAEASAIFAGSEITVIVGLGLGDGEATVWTCDLSHAYVDINGHYRT